MDGHNNYSNIAWTTEEENKMSVSRGSEVTSTLMLPAGHGGN